MKNFNLPKPSPSSTPFRVQIRPEVKVTECEDCACPWLVTVNGNHAGSFEFEGDANKFAGGINWSIDNLRF